ncbi:MAG: hypothetical protein Q7L55_11730 [Actinomycetota bacterium]|nr:hypothetical protein [Actinomycetota bacterium]
MDPQFGASRGYAAEVENARHAARLLRRGAYATAAIGILAAIAAVMSWITGESGLDASVEYFWAFGVATVISGVAFYVSSWSLALSASRLEVQLNSSNPAASDPSA